MSAILDIAAGLLIIVGSSVVGLAGLGLIRLPDPFTRMHAATKAGVVGSGMVMLGVALSLGSLSAIVTGLLGVAFLLATSPIASHALGRAAYTSGAPIAPSTVADALAGVLPRNVFDIAPQRVPRPAGRRTFTQPKGDVAMSAIEHWRRDERSADTAASNLRTVTAWLVGGAAQGDASRVALELARAANARLVGLSATDLRHCAHRGPAPIGGLAWASWLGEQRRTRMRERSAKAIAEFEGLSAEAGTDASLRHEEGGLAAFLPIAAGSDLIVVPALVDRIGEPAALSEEIAAEIAAARLAPVLRVRRRPLRVRRVALLVSNGPQCGRLAQALLRTGLWRDAAIDVIPIGPHREHVAALAQQQAQLLESHGYRVRQAEAIELDAEREAILARCQGIDAAVLGALSCRRGWFGAVREDGHELFAGQAPLTLLP